jgi:multiple sugar transport system permease protein
MSSARLMRIAGFAAIAIALVCALFPFWWLIATSLKLPVDIFSGVSLIPQDPTLDNYERLFVDYDFDAFLINSVGIVSVSVCVSLVLGTLAAYGLARFRFPWRLNEHSLVAALLVRLLPPILLAIPLFITLSEFGLLNTWLGLIIIYSGLNTSFVIWMMQSFFEEVPTEIEDAARVDGDSRLSALRRVVLPLAAPGIAATAILCVITTYNDFLIALSLTSTPDAQTVPVGVSTLIGKIKIEWGPMAAAGVIGALPIVLFALLVQRHFVRGLTLGALK